MAKQGGTFSMGKEDLKVILMDCEQRAGEGVLCSLARDGFSVVGLSSESRCPAFYSRYLASYYKSPCLNYGFSEYLNFLHLLPVRGVIVPSGDLSVIFLSRHKQEIENQGFLVNVVSESLLLDVFDKWQCHNLCREHSVDVATSRKVETQSEVECALPAFEWPVIIKPTRLAGGNYVRAFSESEAIAGFDKLLKVVKRKEFQSHASDVMLQQWIESGMEDNWSCEVFFNKKGNLVDALTVRRIRTSLNEKGTPTSRLYAGVITENEELRSKTVNFLKSIQWKGFAHVEFIRSRDTGHYLLTEVNPRLPGYAYCLSASNHKHAVYYACDLFNLPYSVNPEKNDVYYFESLRYPGDLTDSVVNIFRGFYSFFWFISTYINALLSKNKVVIDHFNRKDIRLTIAILGYNAIAFFRKTYRFLKRRFNKRQ